MITTQSAAVTAPVFFTALADTSRILAAALRHPTRELIRQLCHPSFNAILQQLLADLGLPQNSCPDTSAIQDVLTGEDTGEEEALTALRCAYTALFSHPESPQLPPYESQYLYWRAHPEGNFDEAPRMFVCPAAVDAERVYKMAGLTRSKELNEPGDFIATEVEFLAFLFARISELLTLGDKDSTVLDELEWLGAVYADFSVHIQKWWQSFFDDLASSDIYPVYTLTGVIGQQLLQALSSVSLTGERGAS